MVPESNVKSRLALVAGKYAQPPNVVVVPSARKTFKIEVSQTMDAKHTSVVASPNKQHSHVWSVLDESLKQVMSGEVKHGLRVGKKDPYVAHTVMGGAENPDDFDIELTSAKLKNGKTYTLLCKSYGVMAMLDFVALHEPKKATPKRKAAKKKKKAAPKRKAKKKPARKGAARKSRKKKAA